MDRDVTRAESFKRLEQEESDLDRDVDEHRRRYQELGETISYEGARALVKRFRDLYLNNSLDERDSFDKRVNNVQSLANGCLTLREGKGAGDVLTALIRLEITDSPPEHPETWNLTTTELPGWYLIKFAIPGGLVSTFGISFGTWFGEWLGVRQENFLREYLSFDRCTLDIATHDLTYLPLTRGDDSAIRNSRPEPDAIPVVLAPNEATIAQCIEKAASSADHWDALVTAAAMLDRNKQPTGDALQGWLIEAAGRKAKRPKGTTAARWPKNALRDFAIRQAIEALESCGMPATTNEREPGSACEVCTAVYGLSSATALNIWKSRNDNLRVVRLDRPIS